jgi:hypothetical protein
MKLFKSLCFDLVSLTSFGLKTTFSKNDALTQTFPQRVMVGRCCASLAPLTFIPRAGFSTTTLAPEHNHLCLRHNIDQ